MTLPFRSDARAAMLNLLLQPSTIPTAFALLLLTGIVVHVRTTPKPRPDPGATGDEDAELAAGRVRATGTLAILFGVAAVLVGLLAMMRDAEWFGHDRYKIAVIPTSFLVLGCSIGAITSLHLATPRSSRFLSVVQVGALLVAFGLITCSGAFLTSSM